MSRRQLQPHQAWLIGIPLNLLLSIPAYFPLMFILLGGKVLAGELGVTSVESSLINGGTMLPIMLGVFALALSGILVVLLNLFVYWAPDLDRKSYWVAVFLLLVIPNLFLMDH